MEDKKKMRKSNSDIVTGFISDEGNYNVNRDYFAYIELEDMACWVLADGLDSDEKKLSAEIVVGNIINDFSEKPSLAKKDIKKYILNAHKSLKHDSKLEPLKSSVVVAVTDYQYLTWGNVGNTRIYNLKKDQIVYKSKDHTIAQMMVDIGKVDPKKINQHDERNNIVNYLGMDGKLKISLSKKKYELIDGDSIVLCSAGFWENIKDREIEEILKESENPEEFTDKIEDCILDKENKNLDNYTAASIFVNKVYKSSVAKKKLPYKKIAAFLIMTSLAIGGYAIFNNVQKVKSAKIALANKNKLAKLAKDKERMEKLAEEKKIFELKKKLSSIDNLEKKGDLLYESGEYTKSLEMYLETKLSYEKLKKIDELELLNKKIENVEIVIEGRSLEEQGDILFEKKSYKKSENKYIESKKKYSLVKNYNLVSLEDKIFKTSSVLEAIDFEKEGNIYFSNKNYASAFVKYKKAKDKYSQIKSYSLEKIEGKLKDSKLLSAGVKIDRDGDQEFNKQNYEKALVYYEKVEKLYKKTKFKKEYSNIESKVEKVKEIILAISLEDKAVGSLKKNSLKEAKTYYEESLVIYKKQELIQKEKEIENRIYGLESLILDKEKFKNAMDINKIGGELLLTKDFKNSRLKYLEAKNILQELKKFLEVNEIDENLKKVDFEEELFKGSEYEKKGDMMFSSKNYDEAISNFSMAKNIYSKLGKNEEYMVVDAKVKKAEKKKKKFILF